MSQISDVYESALTLYNQRLFNMSLGLLELGLEDNPDDGRLWELKGLIHRIQQEPGCCREALVKAASHISLTPKARCTLADCQAHYGHRLAARQLYLEVFDDPDSPIELLRDVASGLACINEWGLAANVCREWCQECPDEAEAWYKQCFALAIIEGDVGEIVHSARQAVRLEPRRVDFRTGLAVLLHAISKSQEAYELIAPLSQYDLALVRCRCDLKYLQQIYQFAGDTQRSDWCRKCR